MPTTVASRELAELSSYVRFNLAALTAAKAEHERMSARALEMAHRDYEKARADAKATGATFTYTPPEPGSPSHLWRYYDELRALCQYSPRSMSLSKAEALIVTAWIFHDRNADTAEPNLSDFQRLPFESGRAPWANWLDFKAYDAWTDSEGLSAAELALEALAIVKASAAPLASVPDLSTGSKLQSCIADCLAVADGSEFQSANDIATYLQNVSKYGNGRTTPRSINSAIVKMRQARWPIETRKQGHRIPSSERYKLPATLRGG